MATLRRRTAVPVGSSEWIQQEREQIAQFEDQELEDFVFSVRNETEWLNEHMADIFNNTQLNVTEIFKTPGKLRGKTPRTARKRSPEIRAPLTEIFGSSKRLNSTPARQEALLRELNAPTPSKKLAPLEDPFAPVQKITKQYHDSGYHGMTEDEMEVDVDQPAKPVDLHPIAGPMHLDVDEPEKGGKRLSHEERTTEGSFHSARENLTVKDVAMVDAAEREGTTGPELPGSFPKDTSVPPTTGSDPTFVSNPKERPQVQDQMEQEEPVAEEEKNNDESPDSTVDGSSPPKPLVRKSSLTFAALPAREPLATKKSIGSQARPSNADASKSAALNGSSYFGRFTGGKSLGGSRNMEEDQMEVDHNDKNSDHRDVEDQTKKLHNKSTTQRLHERINMLGKTQPARPTKSIPSATAQQLPYPELRDEGQSKDNASKDSKSKNGEQTRSIQADEEEDWIMPSAPKPEIESRPTLLKSRSVDVMEHIHGKKNISGADFELRLDDSEQTRQQSPLRHQQTTREMSPTKVLAKAASTTQLAFPARESGHQKAISVSNPTFPTESTTPVGSPNSKFHLDGHLSASKSKLQSIMKSAKNLFSSSARVSNQAKMETMSPSPMRIRKLPGQALNEIAETSATDHPVYPDLDQEKIMQLESPTKGRKTRSSTEKEKEQKKKEREVKERQKAEEELKKAREHERQRAAKFQEKTKATAANSGPDPPTIKAPTQEQASRPIRQSPRRLNNQEDKQANAHEIKPPISQPTRPQSQASQITKPKEIKRPIKPTKDTAPRPKPQPVSIRVGTLSQRIPLSSSSLAASQQDSTATSQTKPTGPAKKPSTASQASVSAPSFKSSVSSNTSRAKAPVVRKVERKPAAQPEPQRRNPHKEVEQATTSEDPKKPTHKQVMEKRRLDLNKRDQQQDISRPAAENIRTGQDQRPQHQPPQRPGLGASRPLPKPVEPQDISKPPTASSASAKRILDLDQEDELSRPTRPAAGHNYQPSESKRRKTGDEEILEQPVRLAMAPPIRQSNIKKDVFKSSGFNGNYPMAPPPASIHAPPARPPMVSQTVQQQSQAANGYPPRPAHPIDMSKYTNGKIPFADAPNPPQPAFKTPMSSKKHGKAHPTPKNFSPMFQNGENIVLDEIETSEEEDSDEEREKKSSMPDWVHTPNMNKILLDQEDVNTDAVFGPVPPANLEEWFTKDKNRLHKLRMRTSSANWFGADKLTEDEIKNDAEARQKMSKDGGWTFGLSKLAE